MSQPKPYFLTVRQFTDGHYTLSGRARYIKHPSYSKRPSNYIRSYLLLQKDLQDLFNYIEPSDTSLKTYSFRIHELLTRTCIELEANFKAIFALNKYTRARRRGANLNIEDYCKINQSHYLSEYHVKAPYWSENVMTAVRQPFKDWGTPPDPTKPWILSWYQDYNSTKHDRANSLHLANFENLLDAFCGLVALIASQYLFEDFSPGPELLAASSGWNDGFEPSIGDYFRIVIPRHVPAAERYDFDWETLSRDPSPIQQFDYDAI